MWRKGNFGVVLGNSMGSNEIYVEDVIISTSYNPAFNNAAGSCVSLRILGVALSVGEKEASYITPLQAPECKYDYQHINASKYTSHLR